MQRCSMKSIPCSCPDDVQARIGLVHRQRATASQDFFARVADKFRAQQDLIAGLAQYRESLLSLLDKLSFGADATALEVGPGDGGFLPGTGTTLSSRHGAGQQPGYA